MKNKKSILTMVIAGIMLTGCITQQPPVVVPASTNQTTGVVSPTVTNAGVFEADTVKINGALGELQTLNSASAPINPYAAPIGIVLGLAGWIATGISSLYAASKNKQLNTATGVINTVVSTIESLPPAIAPVVKQAVAATAQNNGTNVAVDAAVQKIT